MIETIRTPKQLGSLVRETRKKLHISQQDLAKNLGVRQALVSEIENGHAALKLTVFLKLMTVLDLDIQIVPREYPSDDEWLDSLLS